MASIAHLTIEIKGTNYGVSTFFACDTHNKVVRVAKADGTAYDVEQGMDRTVCSCPDFQRRHADLPYSAGCKHVRALVEFGLIENVLPWSNNVEPEPEIGVSGAGVEPNAVEVVASVEPVAEAASVEPVAPEATHEGQGSLLAAGLLHTVAELASEITDATHEGDEAPAIDWNALGERYAAGESRSKLAKEAGVSQTKFWNTVHKLGFKSPKKHYVKPYKVTA